MLRLGAVYWDIICDKASSLLIFVFTLIVCVWPEIAVRSAPKKAIAEMLFCFKLIFISSPCPNSVSSKYEPELNLEMMLTLTWHDHYHLFVAFSCTSSHRVGRRFGSFSRRRIINARSMRIRSNQLRKATSLSNLGGF